VLNAFEVKVQLTKDRTIDVSLPFGGKKGRKTDVTGVELYSLEPDGCPAVRVYQKRGEWRVGAAGFVPSPAGAMPECWDDIAKQPSWELPRQFQAPGAAIAVNSPDALFGQASPDAIVQEMIAGLRAPAASHSAPSDAGKKRLGIKRAPSAAKPTEEKKPAQSQPSKRPELPPEGVPVSENGRRFAVRPFAEDDLRLAASLPEYQALWLGRLLPEGKRPTAVSIQLAESALMASVMMQPAYRDSGGSILAVFVRRDAVFFAGYKLGRPALWRRCPGVGGYEAMRAAVKKTLGVEEELVDSVLDDSLVDPRPALEPFLHPVLEQMELARAYLESRHSINSERVLLLGLPSGAGQWSRFAEESLKIKVEPADPFAGFALDKGVEIARPQAFLPAIGAALAAMEVES